MTLIIGIVASMITAIFVTRTFFMIWLQRRPDHDHAEHLTCATSSPTPTTTSSGSGGGPTASRPRSCSRGSLFLLGARAQLQHRVHRRHAGADREPDAGGRRRAPDRPRPRRDPRRRDPAVRRDRRVRDPRAASAKPGTDANDTAGDRARGAARRSTRCSGQGNYTVDRTEAVGPKVGGELRQKAFLAIFLSFFAVLAYLAVPVRVALRPGRHHRHGARHPGDASRSSA